MKAYSQDLRERILRAVDLSRPRAEIMQLFGVSSATIKRYLKQRREEGHVQPKAIPGRPPKKRAQLEAGVLPQLQAHDDATLEQHCDLWEQTHGECEPLDNEPGYQKTRAGREKKSRSGQRSASAGRTGYLASEREQASDRIAGSY